jgi:hypothetical protein
MENDQSGVNKNGNCRLPCNDDSDVIADESRRVAATKLSVFRCHPRAASAVSRKSTSWGSLVRA